MKEPVFEVGERVIANESFSHQITKGKEYVVTEYAETVYDPTFTWPAYVKVIGDFGTPVAGHTYRFRKMGGAA